MKKIILVLCVFVNATFFSCSTDQNLLRKSVFVPDPENAGLPQYSEWGYNTFGAYFDRHVFVSNDVDVPMKVIVSEDSSSILGTTFLFQGQREDADYFQYSMSLSIRMDGLVLQDYPDLLTLHTASYDLTDAACHVILTDGTTEEELVILKGELEFKRAQNLLVDKHQTQVILSGIFNFQTILDGEPISISDGRFDIGVGQSNFFVY